MIERAPLQMKTLKAEGVYERELQSLSAARSHEQACRAHVQAHEKTFWLEVSRASRDRSHVSTATSSLGSSRLERAHRELERSVQLHKASASAAEACAKRSLQAETVRDACHALQRTERRRESLRAEGRVNEEISEIGSFFRAHASQGRVGARRSVQQAPEPLTEGPVGWGNRECLQPPGLMPVSRGERIWGDALRNPSVALGEATNLAFGSCRIESASAFSSPDAQGLCLSCSVDSGRTPVAIRVVRSHDVGITVILSVRNVDTFSQLVRERSAIVHRLEAAGVRVGSVSVEQGGGPDADGGLVDYGAHKTRRRRDDEDLIS